MDGREVGKGTEEREGREKGEKGPKKGEKKKEKGRVAANAAQKNRRETHPIVGMIAQRSSGGLCTRKIGKMAKIGEWAKWRMGE